MKKPLLVANLLFAGLIGVALNHRSMTHGQNPVRMTSTVRSASQYDSGEIPSDNKVIAGSGSSDSTTLQAEEISSNSGSGFLEEGSCSAVKIEVTPCQ